MNTAYYLPINNYSKLGEMGISRAAVRSIVHRCIEKTGAEINGPKKKQFVFNPESDGVKVSLLKSGLATISVEVNVYAGNPVGEICTKIQKEISDVMTLMLDTLPIEVHIKVANILR